MAHFAELDANNIVLRVIVINNSDILDENGNESEQIGIAFCKSIFGEDTNWIQTSYNGSFRKRFAGTGFTYDAIRDAFITPPHVDATGFDEETCDWIVPIIIADKYKQPTE